MPRVHPNGQTTNDKSPWSLRAFSDGFGKALDFCHSVVNQISNTSGRELDRLNRGLRLTVNRKVIERAGHHFGRPELLVEPTRCNLCSGHIRWPIGQRCILCNLMLHRDCTPKIEAECLLGKKRPDSIVRKHKFEKKIVAPTYCIHCGTLVIGLGLECQRNNCNTIAHPKCGDLVCFECKDIEESHTTKETKGHQNCNDTPTVRGRFNLSHFKTIGRIGTGSFSDVYLAKFKLNDKKYALKLVNKVNSNVLYDCESARLEAHILTQCKSCPFIASGICCFQSRNKLFYVMEYAPGGDLLFHLNKRLDEHMGPFPESNIRFYAAELILAIRYLHDLKIIYRDLKPENVVLDLQGHCKLVDFGMSRDLKVCKDMKTKTFCGTPYYMSPELIKELAYDYSIDWWALGVLMYELLNGIVPFGHDCNEEREILTAILEQQVRYTNELSKRVIALLNGLLDKNPISRLGSHLMGGPDEIMKHPFFGPEEFWTQLESKLLPTPFIPEPKPLESVDEQSLMRLSDEEASQNRISQNEFDNFSLYDETLDTSLG